MKLIARALGALGIALLLSSPARAVDSDELRLLQREWWQWLLSIPASQSPLTDNTGQRCMHGQRGDYWFLAGKFTGGNTTSSCTIPAGKKILLPIGNSFCFPDPSFSIQQCYDAIEADSRSYTTLELFINTDDRADLIAPMVFEGEANACGEACWDFAVPRNGLAGFKPGLYKATAAAGNWAILDLKPGFYTVRSHSVSVSDLFGRFETDVTYKLTIAEVALP
jgi:hypothetical protein